jgi:hypothetical protein
MARPKTLIVKFRARTARARRAETVRALVGDDLEAVRPLFPDDPEEELASLFEVVLKDSASLDRVQGALAGAEQIEYAHSPAERRPL